MQQWHMQLLNEFASQGQEPEKSIHMIEYKQDKEMIISASHIMLWLVSNIHISSGK